MTASALPARWRAASSSCCCSSVTGFLLSVAAIRTFPPEVLRAGCATAISQGAPRQRVPLRHSSEFVYKADVRTANPLAVDVGRGGKGLRQTRRTGRSEAGVGLIFQLVGESVQGGVPEDVPEAADRPAGRILAGSGVVSETPIQAADPYFRSQLVVCGYLGNLVVGIGARVGAGDQRIAYVAQRRAAVIEGPGRRARRRAVVVRSYIDEIHLCRAV